jgi:glycosyltransferase involved in cell wall biosynthesis
MAYKEPYLNQTLTSLLENSELGDQLEIIVTLDSYWPAHEMIQDPRVRYIHFGSNQGPKECFNQALKIARGEFIMRLDCHCMFGKGYDRILCEDCGEKDIITARRYFLDPIKWEVMDIPFVDYEKLVIQDGVKFSGVRWDSRTQERKDILLDEQMAMQGSMWVAPRKWFDTICNGRLQTEGYGPAYQDSTEVSMKSWKNGGRFMLTKRTWFAHKFRGFPRNHNEGTPQNPWNKEASWKYALDTWRDYYETVLRPKWNI